MTPQQNTVDELNFLEALNEPKFQITTPEEIGRLLDIIFDDRLNKEILAIASMLVSAKLDEFKGLKRGNAAAAGFIKDKVKEAWKKSEERSGLLGRFVFVKKHPDQRSEFIKNVIGKYGFDPLEFAEDTFIHGVIDEDSDPETDAQRDAVLTRIPSPANDSDEKAKAKGKIGRRKSGTPQPGDPDYCAKDDHVCKRRRYASKFGKNALSGVGGSIAAVALGHGGLIGGVASSIIALKKLRDWSTTKDSYDEETTPEATAEKIQAPAETPATTNDQPAPEKPKSLWQKTKDYLKSQHEDYKTALAKTSEQRERQIEQQLNTTTNSASNQSVTNNDNSSNDNSSSFSNTVSPIVTNNNLQVASEQAREDRVAPAPIENAEKKVIPEGKVLQHVSGHTRKSGTEVDGYDRYVKPKKAETEEERLNEMENAERMHETHTAKENEPNAFKNIVAPDTGSEISREEAIEEKSDEQKKMLGVLTKIEENTRKDSKGSFGSSSDKSSDKESTASKAGSLAKEFGEDILEYLGMKKLVGKFKGAKKTFDKVKGRFTKPKINPMEAAKIPKGLPARAVGGLAAGGEAAAGAGVLGLLGTAVGSVGAGTLALGVAGAGLIGYGIGGLINDNIDKGPGSTYDKIIRSLVSEDDAKKATAPVSKKEMEAYRNSPEGKAKIAARNAAKTSPATDVVKPQPAPTAKTDRSKMTHVELADDIDKNNDETDTVTVNGKKVSLSSPEAVAARNKLQSQLSQQTTPAPNALGNIRSSMSDGTKYISNVGGTTGNTTIINQAPPAATTGSKETTTTDYPKSSDSSFMRYLDRRSNFVPNGSF